MIDISNKRIARLAQMEQTMWRVCDLVQQRRPDLYPANGWDVTGIMRAVDQVWSPGMTAEEVYALVLPELGPPSH